MPVVVAGIHVSLAEVQQARRGWPGRTRPRPQSKNKKRGLCRESHAETLGP